MNAHVARDRIRGVFAAALKQLGDVVRRVRFDRASLKGHIRTVIARVDAAEWTTKLIVSIAVLVVLLLVAGPVHYLFRDLVQLEAESLDRGRSLVRVLALANQEGFARNQEVLFSIDSVRAEPGVEAAVVADAQGIVLAPADYFGKRLDAIAPGIAAVDRTGNDVQLHDLGGGRYYLSYPIAVAVETYRGIDHIVKGSAVIRFNAKSALNRMGYQIAEALKYAALLGLAAWAFVILMRRWTLRPIEDALERLGSVDDAENSVIRFSELERLVAAYGHADRQPAAAARSAVVVRDTAASLAARTIDLKDDGHAVVLDARNVVVAVCGEPGRSLGCEPRPNQHMLEAFAGSSYFSEILEVVQGACPPDGSSARLSRDNKLSITAQWSASGEGDPLLRILADERQQRRRKGRSS